MFDSPDIELSNDNYEKLERMSNAIRSLSMDAVQKANSGHPGMPLGMADVATVLFSKFLKFNPKDPKWSDRDRFILSAGHGSMLLYSLLYLSGYEDMTIEDIKNFRQLGAKTAGHPEFGYANGIETTTGPLGQGVANSVGFAIAEAMQSQKYGSEIVDHFTYVIAGDGCLMEGISHEAISLAGHLNLKKLIVLFDDNGITIDGSTDLTVSDDQQKRFEASGWHVQTIDGHDFNEIEEAIENAKKSDSPSMIACKTTIAFGSPNKAGKNSSHGAPLGDDEITQTKKILNIDYPAFEIPSEILSFWQEAIAEKQQEYNDWQARYSKLKNKIKDKFESENKGDLPDNFDQIIQNLKENYAQEKPKWATRKSSGEVLKTLTDEISNLIGGSADLTGSNLTKTDSLQPIKKGDFSGRYIYYGIREQAMAAAMNGIALHGGYIPFGGTFLVFTDYCRASIRLSALMKQRVIYVMTHDSIGLGEDGPTHQPVEHLASLRAIPNINVFRPASAVETAECWQIALENKNTPSILALTRQGVPEFRDGDMQENKSRKGAYVIYKSYLEAQVTIFASGSEVEIAVDSAKKLEEKNVGCKVVSVPSVELFKQQEQDYRVSFLCNSTVKVAIEAGVKQGWEGFVGPHGIFVGMDSFGASAPIKDLYEKFGITSDNVVSKVLKKLQDNA